MFSERRNSGRCKRPNHLLSRYTSHARAYTDAKYVAGRWFCVRISFPLSMSWSIFCSRQGYEIQLAIMIQNIFQIWNNSWWRGREISGRMDY